MAAFASIGETLENGVAGYGEQISGALITSLGPVIYIGVSLYFLMRGYLIMSGRSQGALGDLAITAGKIALVSTVGLNSGNFVSYGLGFLNGAEGLLMSSLPGGQSTGWEALDNLWGQMAEGIEAMFDLIAAFGITEIGFALLMVILLMLFFFAGALLTLAALGVFIIAKLSLVVVSGFGPLFLCCLMFPVTRSWFDGWLKSCLTYIFTVVMMTAVIALVTSVFSDRVDQILTLANEAKGDDGQMKRIMTGCFTFLIISVALATLIRAVPSMASGVTGGMGMGAVGLGQMAKGIASSATKMGGAAYAANAIGHGALTKGASPELRQAMQKGLSMVAGRTTAGMLMTEAAGAGLHSIRTSRALNAARARSGLETPPSAAAALGSMGRSLPSPSY